MSFAYIDRNIADVRARMEAACRAAGRSEAVELIAAVKYASGDEIRHLTEQCGVTAIGENRTNQLLEHLPYLDTDKVKIHFIGSLQKNKVKYIIDKVCLIHSLDSLSLAEEIDRQAAKHNLVMDVLVEVNCGREENKGGLFPEDVEEFCRALGPFSHIRLCGFMTMAPKCEKKSEYLKYFGETYQLVLDIWRKIVHNKREPILSMGMSGSFEEAIAAGATCVRIGRTLFQT